MKLIIDEIAEHSSTNYLFSWGSVRRFIWETGDQDQPYLAVALSTIVNCFGNPDNPRSAMWAGYRATSFYSTLDAARRIEPTVYDITHDISLQYPTRGEAETSAQHYLESFRAEDFKPEEIV